MSDYHELLLGCGHSREKRVVVSAERSEWVNLTTIDYNRDCRPDFVADLRALDWQMDYGESWADPGQYDEIHAYEILEHLGRQGNVREFFETFYNCWHMLRAGGYLAATVPAITSPWAWGDPGHTRVITKESLIFLDRLQYAQLGKTSMSDYRSLWYGDFEPVRADCDGDTLIFVLRAVKPAREYPKVTYDPK